MPSGHKSPLLLCQASATVKRMKQMRTLIVIPARYGSTRLPGKPLHMIAGQTLLSRVIAIAKEAVAARDDVGVLVATDHTAILNHAKECGVEAVMTPESCPTGSDRVLAALEASGLNPTYVLNLQGDAPFTPADFVSAMIEAFDTHPTAEVVTPVVRLTWDALDTLRDMKKTTPYSGTTAVIDAQGRALWFSKNILPAIRKEESLRGSESHSPVYRHVGLYGYKTAILRDFVTWKEGVYEALEGLEQLRFLENGVRIQAVVVDYAGRPAMSGVDSPEDVARAEALFANARMAAR